MTENRPPATGHARTQGQRRVMYGLNVLIAAAAALAVVVFVNYIGYRHFHQFDLTSTRQYTLSAQTLAALRDLKEPYTIVSLLGTPTGRSPEAVQLALLVGRANDLVDEMGQYSSKLTIEHIDPAADTTRFTDFEASLYKRYTKQLQPEVDAIDAGQKALVEARPATEEVGKAIGDLLKNPALPAGALQDNLQAMTQIIARYHDEDTENDKKFQSMREKQLPSLSDLATWVKDTLTNRTEKGMAEAAGVFAHYLTLPATPAGVKPALEKIIASLKAINDRLTKPLDELQRTKSVDDYDKLITQLGDDAGNVVVLLSPQHERVVTLSEMYPPVDTAQALRLRESGEDPIPAFQGEERLTGALESLGLKVQPLVVFVYSGTESPLSARGGYAQVAGRLRNLNFDVEDWSPLGRPNPFGQPMPPAPPPQPAPGQKSVWVILPLSPTNPMSPGSGDATAKVVEQVQERLNHGDPTLVMMELWQGSRFGEPDPLVQPLAAWGIKAQTDHLLIRQIDLPGRQPVLSTQLSPTTWGQDLAVSKAISGMPTMFPYISPLQLDDKAAKEKGERLYPLIEVTGQDIWAQGDLQDLDPNKIHKPDNAGGTFVVAAAAGGKAGRLIVVGDPLWANDSVTTIGSGQPGLATYVGADYPGNSELFVNSIYWLAGLDQLIASGARAQDVRRVQLMTISKTRALDWTLMVGMPALAAAAGMGVWLVRRRA